MPRIFRIHPTIGIARLGDSPDDYFIGSEAPRILPSLTRPGAPSPAEGKRRDAQHRIKRQGARFHIFEFTQDHAGATVAVREITSAEADVEWRVHLANRKAASHRFNAEGRRNEGVPEERLVIDPGEHSIEGANQGPKRLQGNFMSLKEQVALGDLLTDPGGRLIVLGGFGKSESDPPGLKLDDYANNDGWHDDVSDGAVRATVRLHGDAQAVEADPAWVIVAPPDFAPEIQNVITLYDIVYDMTSKFHPELQPHPGTHISFTRDIYPILRRVSNMHWVSDVAARFHAPGKRGHFVSRVDELASNKEENRQARERIFLQLRNPFTGKGGNMPKLPAAAEKGAIVTLTAVQFLRMEKWANGEFEADWGGREVWTPFEQLPVSEQPVALDRAALESCVGAGRYPGIEAGQVMLDAETYDPLRPFRINDKLAPGGLTGSMALPWQADFRDCTYEDELGLDWWPGQRPNEVWRLEEGKLVREEWVPKTEAWEADETRRLMMVDNWSKLGFVVRKEIDGSASFVEDEQTLTSG